MRSSKPGIRNPYTPLSINTEFRFIGLQRSGNHAVIYWLLKLMDGDIAFYNNVWPNAPYANSADIHHGNSRNLDYCITSYEDRYLPLIARHLDPNVRRGSEPHVTRAINILLMRDPFNLLASRLRSTSVSSERTLFRTGLNPVQLYLHYSREYSGRTNFLGPNLVPVSYNEWKDSEEYRAKLCSRLGILYRAVSVDEIPDYGNGSSFEERGSVSSGCELQTDRRWRHYKNDERYLRFFRNEELVRFGLTHFHLEDGLRDWINDVVMPATSLLKKSIDNLTVHIFPRLLMRLRRLRDILMPISSLD